MNQQSSGLTIDDAQAALCGGTYGRKEYSQSERQAACERYEQSTGTMLENDSRYHEMPIVPILGILIVISVAIIVYLLRKPSKINKHH